MGRKSQAQILLDTDNYQGNPDDWAPLPRGVDRAEETRRLQDRCAYNLGSALPTTAAPLGAEPSRSSQPARLRRRVTFAGLPEARPGSGAGGSSSLPPLAGRREAGAAQGGGSTEEALAQDIVQSVRDKQRDLASVEEALAGLSMRSERVGEGAEKRRLLQKQLASESKRRLEIKNSIARDVQDLEQLLDCAPSLGT